jgi:hypothetical protein
MATYSAIQAWVRREHAFVAKTCWIAHVKSDAGLPVRIAPNRRSASVREVPCPLDKRPAILAALRHFKMLPSN